MTTTLKNRRHIVSLAKSGTAAPAPTGKLTLPLTTVVSSDTLDVFQHSLKTSDTKVHSTVSVDPDSGLTPKARSLLIRAMPQDLKITAPFPVHLARDPEAAVDSMQQSVAAAIIHGIKQEALAGAELLDTLANTEAFKETVASAILDALADLGTNGVVEELGLEFTHTDYKGNTQLELWAYLRQRVIRILYGQCSEPAQALLRTGTQYLDHQKLPKIMLLSGRPPQHTFDLAHWDELGRMYGLIAARVCAELWVSQAGKLPGLQVHDAPAPSFDELQRLGKQAQADLRSHHAQAAAEEIKEREALTKAVMGLEIDDFDRAGISLAQRHGFDPSDRCTIALQRHWVDKVQQVSLPKGSNLIGVKFELDDYLERFAGDTVVLSPTARTTPSVATLCVYDALRSAFEDEIYAALLPEGGPTMTVHKSQDQCVDWEYIQVDGLIPEILSGPGAPCLIITIAGGER